jgi:hypothetical protein
VFKRLARENGIFICKFLHLMYRKKKSPVQKTTMPRWNIPGILLGLGPYIMYERPSKLEQNHICKGIKQMVINGSQKNMILFSENWYTLYTLYTERTNRQSRKRPSHADISWSLWLELRFGPYNVWGKPSILEQKRICKGTRQLVLND